MGHGMFATLKDVHDKPDNNVRINSMRNLLLWQPVGASKC
jgi:hypothetical protein